MRHDGEVNPESRDTRVSDGPRVKLMANSVGTLALAYYFTAKERYAAHTATFARVWFLEPATRMNHRFKYAQAVRGENDGRSIRRALGFMFPFLEKPGKNWLFQQIKDRHNAESLPILHATSLACGTPDYDRIARQYSEASSMRYQLIYA